MPYESKSIARSRKPEDLAPPEYFAWKQKPDKDNLGKLLTKIEPTLKKAVTSYTGEPWESWSTQSRIMAAQCFNKYDPGKGMALNSYIMQGMQSLNRAKADRYHVVHIPENNLLARNRIAQATGAFEAENGREPTLAELSDTTGMSKKIIETAKGVRTFNTESSSLTEKGDLITGATDNYERVWTDYVYHDLDNTDKKIFEWTTGYGGAPIRKKIDISKRLKISPSSVSLRINRIVRKLEEGSQYGK